MRSAFNPLCGVVMFRIIGCIPLFYKSTTFQDKTTYIERNNVMDPTRPAEYAEFIDTRFLLHLFFFHFANQTCVLWLHAASFGLIVMM